MEIDLDGVAVPDSGYRCIVVDPPWRYGAWGKGSKKSKFGGNKPDFDRPLPYPSLSIDEIKLMDIRRLAASNCDLYLWTTQKYLPDAFGVLNAWGFKYCQTLAWCKSPMGTGQGGLFCPTTEFILLGRRGKMPKDKKRIDSTWWNVTRQQKHSKKPEFFQDMIEQVSDAPRIELFARRARLGWDAWGNEV